MIEVTYYIIKVKIAFSTIKLAFFAVQLSRRREEKSFDSRFLGATDGYFFSYQKKKGRLMA
jgi:hypothetical protein